MSKPAEDSDKILRYFGRHLVALCISSRNGSDRVKFTAHCGTLVRVEEHVLWLSAGHIIRNIQQAFASHETIIESCVLADAFGNSFVSDQPIPIDFQSSTQFFVDDDQGLDFGAVALHPNHVRLLVANGVCILEEENWAHQHQIDFTGFMLMGLPDEFSTSTLPTDRRATVTPTMISVHRLDAEPACYQTPSPRFVARIAEPIPLSDLVGMSGGPIFGFSWVGDNLLYWIVAIQSSWLKSNRTIFGCPLTILAPRVVDWARSL